MLSKLVLSVVIGVVVTLACLFIGGLLVTFRINWVIATGQFLQVYGALLGLLSALWCYFAGYTHFPHQS